MPPHPLSALSRRFRRARYRQLQETLRLEEVRGLILDLGGGPARFLSALYPRLGRVVYVARVHGLAQRRATLFGGDFDCVESVRYLSADDLTRLFPAADIVAERFLGLTKSLCVISPTAPA